MSACGSAIIPMPFLLQRLERRIDSSEQSSCPCVAHCGSWAGARRAPHRTGFREMGWEVLGADNDSAKVLRLKSGDPSFYEAGLEELLRKHLQTGLFKPVEDLAAAIRLTSDIRVIVDGKNTLAPERACSAVFRICL